MKRIVQNIAPIDPAAWRQRERIRYLSTNSRMVSGEIAKALDLRHVDVIRIIRAGKGKGD